LKADRFRQSAILRPDYLLPFTIPAPGEWILKKIGFVVALMGVFALSLFLFACGSSSSRPSGVLYALTQGINGYGNNVSSFAVNLSSGSLSLVNYNASTCPAAASLAVPEPCGLPLDILLDPAGTTAFVLNQGTPCVQQGNQCQAGSATILPTIYSYSVNSDGSLSAPGMTPAYWTCIAQPVGACTASNSNADTAVAMVRDAAGQFLFVIDQGVYPQPATCPAMATAVSNAQQATDFMGCPSISVFALKSGSGATTLTPVSQSSTYQSPLFLSKTPSSLSTVTFTPGGAATQELLFVSNNYDLCTVSCLQSTGVAGSSPPHDSTLSEYVVNSSGVLTEQTSSPYVLTAANPTSVLGVYTNQSGQNALFVYVGSQDVTGGHLYPFSVCSVVTSACTQEQVAGNLVSPLATCPLQSCDVAPSSVGQQPVQMLSDPTGNFLYVLSEGSNQVFGFKVNPTAGTLTVLNPANQPTGSQPVSMALHASVNALGQPLYNSQSGQFLFTSNTSSSNISGFTLSTTTGSLSNPITVITPAAPSGMAVH
jgi:hypothetical protein